MKGFRKKEERQMTTDSWESYGKLVLKELETLADGVEAAHIRLNEMDSKDAILEERIKTLFKDEKKEELWAWKKSMQEVCSVKELEKQLKELESLKIFKTKAITVFAVVQFGMVIVSFAMKFWK